MIYRLTVTTILAIILTPLNFARAQEVSWFQVEVIVFDYAEPDLDSELWFENPGWPVQVDAIDLITSVPDPVQPVTVDINLPVATNADAGANPAPVLIPYLALAEEKYRLANDYRRLRLSSLYRPLLHVAWQQPGRSAEHTRYVHLERLVNTPVAALDPETVNETEVTAAPAYDPPRVVFDGLVRLRVPNFLYIDIDFSYFPEDLETILTQQLSQSGGKAQLVNPDADYVRMQETRRIYLNELNYFDHPLFGVLLQVSRLEAEE